MDHCKVINRILKYLRYVLDYRLHYTRYTSILESYGDSKWIFDVKDFKFTSGYVFILGGAVVS
jgi:hypothetical protein